MTSRIYPEVKNIIIPSNDTWKTWSIYKKNELTNSKF